MRIAVLRVLPFALAFAAGCATTPLQSGTSRAAQPARVTAGATGAAEKTPPAEPAAAPEAAPAVPKTRAQVVGDKLAAEWCTRGGTGFGAFGTENALRSCSAIKVRVEKVAKTGDIESAVIVLQPETSFSEEERYLFLERGDEVAVFFLVHGFSSGIGGFSHEIEITKIESKHAWAAEIESESHDSDMGICAETGSEAKDIVVCTHGAEGFACIQVPVSRNDYEWSTSKKDGECGEAKTKDIRKGFATTAKVDGDSLEVRTERRTSFTQARTAPFVGRAPIARLSHKLPAKRVLVKS